MSFHLRTTFAGLAVAALFAGSATAADVTLKLASTTLENQPAYPYITEMVKEIEAADVGITVQFFPAGQLGSGEELLEDTKFGNVDMVHAAIYAQADQRLEVLDLPFLITTQADIENRLSNPDSQYNQIVSEILADHGLYLIASIGEGLIGMVAAKEPADVHGTGNKEVNVRVWTSQVVKSTIELLGYQTTTMNWAEVFPAVQAGTIDGAICCTSELAYSLFASSDVGNTFIPYNAFVERNFIYMNAAKWGQLTDEQKQVVRDATVKAAKGINDSSWQRSEEFLEKLREKGWTVVEFTDEERAAFKGQIVDKIWPTVGDIAGQDLVERMSAD